MHLSRRQLNLVEIALDAQIKKIDAFHNKVDYGSIPDYDPLTLRIGKELNVERKELLEDIRAHLKQ